MSARSHGDGRRMTVTEAVERRARMTRFHGSLAEAFNNVHHSYTGGPNEGRSWSGWNCVACLAETTEPTDVRLFEAGTLDEDAFQPAADEVMACCPACRGAA